MGTRDAEPYINMYIISLYGGGRLPEIYVAILVVYSKTKKVKITLNKQKNKKMKQTKPQSSKPRL